MSMDATPSSSGQPDDSESQNQPLPDASSSLNEKTFICPDEGKTKIGTGSDADSVDMDFAADVIISDPVLDRIRELKVDLVSRFETTDRGLRKQRGEITDSHAHYKEVLVHLFGSEVCAESLMRRIMDTRTTIDALLFRESPNQVRAVFLKEEQLGEGGMGSVVLGRFPEGDLVIKMPLLHPETGKVPLDLLRRFEREIEVMQNTAIGEGVFPKVLHTGKRFMELKTKEGGLHSTELPYYTMEYLDSVTDLDAVVKAIGKLPLEAAIDIALLVTMKLHKIALADTAHRDVKLKNILLLPTGEIRIIDPGLAKEQGHEDITQPHQVLGSVRTIPPERLIPALVGENYQQSQADIYGAGIVTYELATGREALVIEDVSELAPKHAAGYKPDMKDFERSQDPRVKSLEKIIAGMSQRMPSLRWSYNKSIEALFEISSFRERFKTLEAFEQETSAHRIRLPKNLIPTDHPADRGYRSKNEPVDFGRGLLKEYGLETVGDAPKEVRSKRWGVYAGITASMLGVAGAAAYLLTQKEKPSEPPVSATQDPEAQPTVRPLPVGATLYPQGDALQEESAKVGDHVYRSLKFGNDVALLSPSSKELVGVQFSLDTGGELVAIDHHRATTFSGSGGALVHHMLSMEDLMQIESDIGITSKMLTEFQPGQGPKFVAVQLVGMPLFFVQDRFYVFVETDTKRTMVFTDVQDLGKYLDAKGIAHALSSMQFDKAFVAAQENDMEDSLGRTVLSPELFGESQMATLQKELEPIRRAIGLQ